MARRLTEERAEKTWRLFRITWYGNIVVAVLFLILAGRIYARWFLWRPDDPSLATAVMIGLVTWALIMVAGAGFTRAQSRIESQHLDILRAVDEVKEELRRSKE